MGGCFVLPEMKFARRVTSSATKIHSAAKERLQTGARKIKEVDGVVGAICNCELPAPIGKVVVRSYPKRSRTVHVYIECADYSVNPTSTTDS